MTKMQTIISNDAVNILCKLFSEYRACEPTKTTLDELREELGPAEYRNFEIDLAHNMRETNAWKAVAEIIGAAMKRKKASLISD